MVIYAFLGASKLFFNQKTKSVVLFEEHYLLLKNIMKSIIHLLT